MCLMRFQRFRFGFVAFVEAGLVACPIQFVCFGGFDPAAASPANWALIVAASRSIVARGLMVLRGHGVTRRSRRRVDAATMKLPVGNPIRELAQASAATGV